MLVSAQKIWLRVGQKSGSVTHLVFFFYLLLFYDYAQQSACNSLLVIATITLKLHFTLLTLQRGLLVVVDYTKG